MELSDDFKRSVKEEYKNEEKWSQIQDILAEREDPEEDTDGINFMERNGLLFYRNLEGDQLCLPGSVEREVFEMAHDANMHAGFTRSYARLAGVYIPKLYSKLKNYILHCRPCQLNQTKRHAVYGQLKPITASAIPFHTVTMNFIVAMPETNGCDPLLTVTDKFSKRVSLIPGKTTFTAPEWAQAYLNGTTDWGLPKVIISNRDSKFMSVFWQATFRHLRIKLLASTAYHPQTDGQSERTNQTVEIALRYMLTEYEIQNWTRLLPTIQRSLNNAENASTGKAPNEVVYGFKT